MAESSEKKETMMRRKDLRGAQEWIGAEELMRSLMVWRLSGRKISMSWRLVIRRVLEGGVGAWRGGMADRSIERGVREREEGRDDCVELGVDMMMMMMIRGGGVD